MPRETSDNLFQRVFANHALVALLLGAIFVVANPDRVDAFECGDWSADAQKKGKIHHPELDEASGITPASEHDQTFWLHNDSGGRARLFLTRADGTHYGIVELEGIEPTDWEDMSRGPCPENMDASCLFIGDFGDNNSVRNASTIHYLREPDVSPCETHAVPADKVHSVSYKYVDGARDAETLLVHPATGDLYIVEKTSGKVAGVYRFERKDLASSKQVQLDRVATIEMESALAPGRMATGGAIAPDGSEMAIRSYTQIFTFCLPDEKPFRSIFDQTPVTDYSPGVVQGETLTYGADGQTLWLSSEGEHAPIYSIPGRDNPSE